MLFHVKDLPLNGDKNFENVVAKQQPPVQYGNAALIDGLDLAIYGYVSLHNFLAALV